MTSKKEGYSVKVSIGAKNALDKAHKLTGCSKISIIEEAIKVYCAGTIKIIEASKDPKKRNKILKFLEKIN